MAITYKNNRNPILPLSEHIPDGEAHMMPDGKLYIYGSYDDDNPGYCSGEYHVVSTGDMLNWTVHDTAFTAKEVPWFAQKEKPEFMQMKFDGKSNAFVKRIEAMGMTVEEMLAMYEASLQNSPPLLYAPDAIHKDGRYYLYFCMSDNSEGVAVSDCPEGPFSEPVQMHCNGIDPAVFIDDDGKAYYYWGQISSKGVQLNADMMSFDESKVVHDLLTEEEHYFHEGSSMRKIGDTYYSVFADIERGKASSLGYATSKSPLGPFEYRGIIIDNAQCDPDSWNNHGSIECVNGKWYVFYHRNSRSDQTHRRLCIEPITILEDGTIPEVKPSSQGIGAPFGPGEKIYGYQACALSGTAYIDIDGNGSENLAHISDGDTAVFRYVESCTGFTEARVEVNGSGMIEVFLDEEFVGKGKAEEKSICRIELRKRVCQSAELKLRFTDVDGLKLISVTLE